MLPELTNIQITYPFIDTGFSSEERAFVNSIKYVRLYLYSQWLTAAAVTAFSPQQIQISLFYGDVPEKIYVNTSGQISDPSGNLVSTKNSFVLFSSPVTGTSSSCMLYLLPQAICLIKRGLTIRIAPPQVVHSQAQNRDLSNASYWKQFDGGQLNFQQGYNFQPAVSKGALQLQGTPNAGLGLPKASQVRELISEGQSDSQQPEAYHSDSYYYGVKDINGITENVTLGTSGGLYLQTTLAGKVLRLNIKQTESASDSSQ